jgi:hypothetical protein
MFHHLVVAVAVVLADSDPVDPRHHFDARCVQAVLLDPAGQQRDPASSSTYLHIPMQTGSTVEDCATLCCHDWSCLSFAFYSAQSAGEADEELERTAVKV